MITTSPGDDDPEGEAALAALERFMTWLSRLLMSSLYPSAPYERKQMAMDLLGAPPGGLGSGATPAEEG